MLETSVAITVAERGGNRVRHYWTKESKSGGSLSLRISDTRLLICIE